MALRKFHGMSIDWSPDRSRDI